MFRHIVVGADGSRQAEDAIALAATIAAATGGELTLLRWASRSPTDAAQALRSHAERHCVDLVVIGARGHAPLGRCAISSAGRHLLGKTSAALAIASRGLSDRHPQLQCIGVGYDGGTESERALGIADELARVSGAELAIETIYEVPTPPLALGDASARTAAEQLHAAERRRALAVAERAATRTSPRSRASVRVGDPGLELRRASARVDLMVIGSRGRGPAARIILGGAGEALASDCGSSLLITPKQSGLHRERPLLHESPYVDPHAALTSTPSSSATLVQ